MVTAQQPPAQPRKKIAISMSPSKTQFFINQAYVDYLLAAGLEPIAVFPGSDMDAIVAMCDGLLLPGGIDIDPLFYGEENIQSFGTDLAKDIFERALLNKFMAAAKPVMGICRGFQLFMREFIHNMSLKNLNMADRFTYYQNLPGHSLVESLSVGRDVPTHFVKTIGNRLYTDGLGKELRNLPVNSIHHQAVTVTHTEGGPSAFCMEDASFEILAYTTKGIPKDAKGDVVLEAARYVSSTGAVVMGVQWHPEELKDLRLVANFFNNYQDLKVLKPAPKQAKTNAAGQ